MSAVPPGSSLLESLFDSLDAPVVATDREGRIRRMNDAAEHWLGRSRGRSAGQSLTQIDPWGGVLAPLVVRTLAKGMAIHENIEIDGTKMSIAASPWWATDAIEGVVLLARALPPEQENDQRTDIATLAAGLAHEVRNPLAALRGATELLAGELISTPGTVREYLDLILRETARVDSLVTRLLSVAKPMGLARRPVSSGELVHDLAMRARAFAQVRGATVAIEERFDPALPPVSADHDVLLEALMNLVKNAIEALPANGGRLTIQVGLDPNRRLLVSGRQVSLLRLIIRDNGSGLGTTRARLFTPFFSTKPAGTGLGLIIARRAIEAHGGMLALRENPPPEGGTEACVVLPMDAPHA